MREHKSESGTSQGAGSSHTSCTEWQGGHRIVREYVQTASPALHMPIAPGSGGEWLPRGCPPGGEMQVAWL